MSQTLSEPVLHTPPPDSARPWRRSWTRWPRRIVFFLVFLWLADFGVSLLIRQTRLQRRLTARLESVFGRSVEVGRYDFSLWGGPTLEAQSVTFGEDPRFGHEYFLRADSLTVRLRWQSFFRGHMELGAMALEHPSLNLVRNEEGDWNVAEWLPKSAAAAAPSSSSLPAPAVRFGRIDVTPFRAYGCKWLHRTGPFRPLDAEPGSCSGACRRAVAASGHDSRFRPRGRHFVATASGRA
jgi:hypothetical protein